MTIHHQVLGRPGKDNALFLKVDSGQSITRLLFDCGGGCLDGLGVGEIQGVDHVLFSHLHLDHVAGFDAFLRWNYARRTKPNELFGPPGSARILQHRFCGSWWNLIEGADAAWLVHEVDGDRITTTRFELAEAFEHAHDEGTREADRLVRTDTVRVRAVTLEHHGPCLGYIVREPDRQNIDMQRVAAAGLRPGPWIAALKSAAPGATIDVHGEQRGADELRAELLTTAAGDSIAYLTDFLLDEPTERRLVAELAGVRTLVCEAQYRAAEEELAVRNHHTTTVRVAQLAARAGVECLELMHLSDRYPPGQWPEMLDECRRVFAPTRFPDGWLGR